MDGGRVPVEHIPDSLAIVSVARDSVQPMWPARPGLDGPFDWKNVMERFRSATNIIDVLNSS
jgi:hypothetical protein